VRRLLLGKIVKWNKTTIVLMYAEGEEYVCEEIRSKLSRLASMKRERERARGIKYLLFRMGQLT
jgi:hypothetical protein